MKNIKSYVQGLAFLLALYIGTIPVFAQTSRNMGLTGGPDGDYSGFEMPGLFNLSFNNVPGINPTTTGPLPANSLQIVLALPNEIEFDDNYTPPAGWSFTKTGPNSVVLKQIAAISSSFPASFVTFAIPITTKAAVVDGVWSAQVQKLLPTYQDPDMGNNTPNGTVSVADVNLPVELVEFSASIEGTNSLLSWKTTEEINSAYFGIQHSTNAKDWADIGRVDSHGDSKAVNIYSFVHQTPSIGSNYYRLKMVDRDETFSLSKIRTVSIEGQVSVYPNPVADKLSFNIGVPVKEVTIFAMNGERKLSATPKANQSIDIRTLPNGLYLIKLKDQNGALYTQKFLVNH